MVYIHFMPHPWPFWFKLAGIRWLYLEISPTHPPGDFLRGQPPELQVTPQLRQPADIAHISIMRGANSPNCPCGGSSGLDTPLA